MSASLRSLVDPAVCLTPELDRCLLIRMREVSWSSASWLDSELDRLLNRPSKRLRPALLFASAACATGFHRALALDFAVAAELLHLGSLVHDDLMDGAQTRAGQATVHATHGPSAAVLVGDHLIAAGGRLAGSVMPAAGAAWHDAYAAMCEGQACEEENRYRLGTLEEYLATVYGKTAALFGAACRLGGLAGGLPEEQVKALADYGAAFGTMFQIIDDLMDVLSTAQLWAKPVRQDLGLGVYTLPVLIAAAAPGSVLPAKLAHEPPSADVAALLEIVRTAGTAPTIDAIYTQAQQACQALLPLHASPARDQLAALPTGYATVALTDRVAPCYAGLVAPHLR